MITKTEITGRTFRTATGRDNHHQSLHVAIGTRVHMTGWYDCGDGGDISTTFYGTITRIGQGTEYGMVGSLIALAEVAWDAHHGRPAQTGTVAIRHLKISRS